MAKTISSNIFEVRKGFEETESTFRGLGKKYNESAGVMKSYAKKTNVDLFSELAGIMEGFADNQIKQIVKLTNECNSAAVEAHNKMHSVANSLDI